MRFCRWLVIASVGGVLVSGLVAPTLLFGTASVSDELKWFAINPMGDEAVDSAELAFGAALAYHALGREIPPHVIEAAKPHGVDGWRKLNYEQRVRLFDSALAAFCARRGLSRASSLTLRGSSTELVRYGQWAEAPIGVVQDLTLRHRVSEMRRRQAEIAGGFTGLARAADLCLLSLWFTVLAVGVLVLGERSLRRRGVEAGPGMDSDWRQRLRRSLEWVLVLGIVPMELVAFAWDVDVVAFRLSRHSSVAWWYVGTLTAWILLCGWAVWATWGRTVELARAKLGWFAVVLVLFLLFWLRGARELQHWNAFTRSPHFALVPAVCLALLLWFRRSRWAKPGAFSAPAFVLGAMLVPALAPVELALFQRGIQIGRFALPPFWLSAALTIGSCVGALRRSGQPDHLPGFLHGVIRWRSLTLGFIALETLGLLALSICYRWQHDAFIARWEAYLGG